jgi:hypothetical protein
VELAEVIHSDNGAAIKSDLAEWIVNSDTMSSGDVELRRGREDFLHDRLWLSVLGQRAHGDRSAMARVVVDSQHHDVSFVIFNFKSDSTDFNWLADDGSLNVSSFVDSVHNQVIQGDLPVSRSTRGLVCWPISDLAFTSAVKDFMAT